MSLKNAPAFYTDRHGELQPTEATGRLFRMFDAQIKEMTGTMLVFENIDHSLKIIHESRGTITATVRDLASAEMLYTVRFSKKNRQGAIYTFRDAGRLSLLGFEPDKIVIDHRAKNLRKIGEDAEAKGLDPEAARQAELHRARPLALLDQLDFSRDFALAFALAAQDRLPGSVLVSVRKPEEPSATTRAKPDERVHTVLDLGNDRWLDATGVRSRERLVKALRLPVHAVFHVESPAAVTALRRETDPARLFDARQTLDASHWRADSLPSSNGALAAQRMHIEQARSTLGPRRAPVPSGNVFNAADLVDDPFAPARVARTVGQRATPETAGPTGAVALARFAGVTTASTPIPPTVPSGNVLNAAELADDPFTPARVSRTVAVGQRASDDAAGSTGTEVSSDTSGLSGIVPDEAAQLRAMAEAPTEAPSIGRRTPIGQRHAPWRHRA